MKRPDTVTEVEILSLPYRPINAVKNLIAGLYRVEMDTGERSLMYYLPDDGFQYAEINGELHAPEGNVVAVGERIQTMSAEAVEVN